MLTRNFLLQTDSYKASHKRMLPHDLVGVYSYFELRGGLYPYSVFYGLQAILQEYLVGEVFSLMDVADAAAVWSAHFGRSDVFDANAWYELYNAYGGRLPLQIKAVAEGSVIPTHNALFTIENTDKRFPWLVGHVEGLLMKVWYPMVIATRSHRIRKQLLTPRLLSTSDDWESAVDFAVHDFSYRGHTSEESAALGSSAHLLSFEGTDTIVATQFLKEYYDASNMMGFSVPAAEHSVIMAHDNERDAFNAIMEAYPNGIVSIVSDTYDYRSAVETLWCSEFKDKLGLFDGKIVIRPDCFDDTTKILTRNDGWKLFQDLTDEDEVAQVTQEGTQEWVKPLRRVSYDYDGDMIHFTDAHGKVDSLVTPNHRVIIQTKEGMEVAEASDLSMNTNKKAFIRAASSNDNERPFSSFDALRVAFQADGSFSTNSTNSVRFNFAKEHKIVRLRAILEDLGVPFSEYSLSSGQTSFSVTIASSVLQKDFSWVDVNNVGKEWARAFIEELSYWDATRRTADRFKFDTTNEDMISVVERIALSSGYGVLITRTHDVRSDKFKDVFTAHITKNNLSGGQSITKNVVPYKGKVYCVTVPSGAVLVKRNRSVLVSGNSGDPFTETEFTLHKIKELLGTTTNRQGFHQLPPYVGVIWGDGMDEVTIPRLFNHVVDEGFVPQSLVTGSGTGLMGGVTRDTQKAAIKASAFAYADGTERYVAKTPQGDVSKVSKKGRLALVYKGEEYQTIQETPQMGDANLLTTVFEDGSIVNKQTFAEIRNRLRGVC